MRKAMRKLTLRVHESQLEIIITAKMLFPICRLSNVCPLNSAANRIGLNGRNANGIVLREGERGEK